MENTNLVHCSFQVSGRTVCDATVEEVGAMVTWSLWDDFHLQHTKENTWGCRLLLTLSNTNTGKPDTPPGHTFATHTTPV